MEFLKTNRLFDFVYGETQFSELSWEISRQETENTVETQYRLADGLVVRNIAKKIGGAYEWVNWFENTGNQPTEVISQLWDSDITVPMAYDGPVIHGSWHPAFEEKTWLFAPKGSNLCYDEFYTAADREQEGGWDYVGHIKVGATHHYENVGGRSSHGNAPFFQIHKDNAGYFYAVGWTGQWNCEISRGEKSVTFRSKIQDTHFRILPGEKFRTSSCVLMPYTGTVEQGVNQWRRLLKNHYSLIGQPGRCEETPISAMMWGGMESKDMLKRIEAIKTYNLPCEYVWVDAGWYGSHTLPSKNEFVGDWYGHTGDWTVSPYIHPQGLRDVSEAVHRAGMKFLLWFEPERVIRGTPVTVEHPEYIIFPYADTDGNCILNLGHPDAWQYCFDTLRQMIREIGIDCYRQDFNTEPLTYWQKIDTPERQGIAEILHINGLYRLWDALLEEFPHLLIDNCASGGRRIDIETLRRSVPLWRSDYQCPANYPELGSQCHGLTFPRWMPYSATGTGRIYDTYRFRSAYASGLNISYSFADDTAFGDDPEKMAWLRDRILEYRKLRPYLSEDFYPLTDVSDRRDVWSAQQYHRPAQDDGILQVFRRENSPYDTACFTLGGICGETNYIFTDADSGEAFTVSGKELLEKGLFLRIPEKRTAKIWFYRTESA